MIINEVTKGQKVKIIAKGTSWSGDINRLEADITKIRNEGFEPQYSLEKGLEMTIQSFEEENSI